jgi:hypothetical protein
MTDERRDEGTRPSPRLLWGLAVVLLFAGRLLFGLSSKFFSEDESQIFLIGLRHYATGAWPYFGPDIVWTRSEIPGALQGLLISLPLKLAPVPESPVVLLNLLSFGALGGLAWYIGKRLPSLPRWLVWGWLMTAPWTLQFSTHLINPSYVLPASVLFFIGFFEAVPSMSCGLLSLPMAHLMMGFGVTWILQIHMSWPLLLPYVLIAWLANRARGVRSLVVTAVAFAAGMAIPGALLAPTLLRFGAHAGSGGTIRNLHPHLVTPGVFVTTLARFFSFASLEIHRFIATDNAKRIVFFTRHPWVAPLALIVWIAGIVQPVWMLVSWIRGSSRVPAWRTLRWLVAFTVVLVSLSYAFVMEPPQAHAFYLLAPIAFVFAAYCWSLVDSPRWRVVAAGVLGTNMAFEAAHASIQIRNQSLYENRQVVVEAIRLKEPEIFGHRRAYAVDPGPPGLNDPSRPFDSVHDVKVLDPVLAVGVGGTANWTITIVNANPRVAFRDILYFASYQDAAGRTIEQHHEFIRRIFEPGESRSVELNDGFAPPVFDHATLNVAAAEALVPSPARLTLSDIY